MNNGQANFVFSWMMDTFRLSRTNMNRYYANPIIFWLGLVRLDGTQHVITSDLAYRSV